MNRFPPRPPLLAATASVTVRVPDGLRSAPFDAERTLLVPAGFAAEVWARIPGARFMAVTPAGDVLVSQPEQGAITLLQRDGAAVPAASRFASGLNQPHDLVFHVLDARLYLYVAEADRVTRYPFTAGLRQLPAGEVIVRDLPVAPLPGRSSYRHPLKNIALTDGTLFVSIGSSTNADPADLEQQPARGAVHAYSASTPEQPAQDGELYASGLRNAEGLAVAPDSGALWAVVNQRDETRYPFHDSWRGSGSDDYGKEIQEFVDDYPAEQIIEVTRGAHYGWPFCNPNPAAGYDDMPLDPDVETNPQGRRFDCQDADRTTKGLKAHSAPLGASFWSPGPGRDDLLVVALHGSWNRAVMSGCKVIALPHRSGQLGVEYDLVSGWLTDAATSKYWGRPVDAVPLDENNLLISDDHSGTVYRLYRPT